MKWLALLLTILLYAWTWVQIMPEYADLPPCHMMTLLLASSIWTAYLFRRRPKRYRPGHCQRCGCDLEGEVSGACPWCGEPARCRKCGYDLTGNVSGRCPECGTPICGGRESKGTAAATHRPACGPLQMGRCSSKAWTLSLRDRGGD